MDTHCLVLQCVVITISLMQGGLLLISQLERRGRLPSRFQVRWEYYYTGNGILPVPKYTST